MSEPMFRFSPRPNHADQVHWHAYGPEAFRAAKREDKPVVLAISAVWCHWCHVMDETTYSDPEVIRRLNEHFIPIRVDSDQRPDVNLRYNMGGWPTVAVLTPEGETITGGTYVPAEQFLPLLDQVLEYWRDHRDELPGELSPPQPMNLTPDKEAPEEEAILQVLEAVRQQFDRAYGGLGVAPKFPHFEAWELCLARFAASGGQEGWAAGMAVRTLDAMAGSNLYDAIGGGFFRYSTNREWSIPHFEKLLEDNALMVRLYLRAYQILGDETYRQVADAVLRWANATLLNQDGLWGGSQDADESYYQLPPEEREKAPQPYVDPVIQTHANAEMVSSQLLGAALISPETYAPIALTALEALWDRMWSPDHGLYHCDNGEEPALPGLLTDLVKLGNALIDGFEYQGDPVYLERAEALIAYAKAHLAADHCYYDKPEDTDAEGRLRHRQTPLPENALMARLLWRLGAIQGDDARMAEARQILATFNQVAVENGVFGSPWATVADQVTAPLFEENLVESAHHSGHHLRQAIFGVYDRNRVLRTLRTGTEAFQASQFPELPVPALYLCREGTCSAPITNPEGILPALQQLAGIPVEEAMAADAPEE